jgi:hypothetical protein
LHLHFELKFREVKRMLTGVFFGKNTKPDIMLQEKIKIRDSFNEKNVIVLGGAGSGKAHHPWDCLKTCICGERPLLMYDQDRPYYCGGETNSVLAICPNCRKNTEKGDIETTIINWNSGKIKQTDVL